MDAGGFGCKNLGTIEENLGMLGVQQRNRELVRNASHTFHLWETARPDMNRLINDIETKHNDPAASQPGIGFVKYAEPEPELQLNTEPEVAIGKNFDFDKTWHPKYRNNMVHIDQCSYTGNGVDIAVIDSGVEPAAKGVVSFNDILGKSNTEVDDSGHGTAMVRIINDIAPDANIYVYRAVEQRVARLWDVMSAIATAVSTVSPKIINLSLGIPKIDCMQCGGTTLTRTRVCRDFVVAMNALQRNLNNTQPIYVAAVGNQGRSNGFNIPAYYDLTLAVGATDSNYERSVFSNYGTPPNEKQKDNYLLLPGGKTDSQDKPVEYIGTATDDNNYTTYCIGTSPATAMATGLLALYMEKNYYDGRNPSQILDRALKNCNNQSIQNYTSDEHGKGMFFYQ